MTVNNPPRLLILDCDGVLVRSERANLAYYNHLFAHFGFPEVREEDREALRLLHTLSTPQVIETFFSAHLREAAKNFASVLEFSKFSGLLQGEEGWTEVLPRLRPRHGICVATNRGRSAKELLDSLGILSCVDRLFTVNDVTRPKPAPDLLQLALSHFGAEPGRAVYVGDSELDQSAADAAGVPFIGFRFNADVRVEDPWELEKILLSA